MIHHYQEEISNFIEKAAELFGLSQAGIYAQFAVMLGTLSFLKFGENTNLFIIPAMENFPIMHTAAFVFGVTAKFFTTCVGAIATFKFVSTIMKGLKEKFNKPKSNGQDNITKD